MNENSHTLRITISELNFYLGIFSSDFLIIYFDAGKIKEESFYNETRYTGFRFFIFVFFSYEINFLLPIGDFEYYIFCTGQYG